MELLELTRELVSRNSSPEVSNEEIINFIETHCLNIGFNVQIKPYKNDNGITQFNLVATKGGNGKPILGLSGHTDTVKFNDKEGEPKCWTKKPLELTDAGDRYYGLGVTDMKLFLAMALKAGEAVDAKQMKRPLALYFSAEEEVGCNGISHLLPKNGEPLVEVADYIVIGEPTEMKPGIAHKGYFNFQVIISSTVDESIKNAKVQSVHSSDDTKATNVVEVILPRVSDALAELRKSLKGHTDFRFRIPYPTLNFAGKITYPANAMKNIIPIYITVDCELRSMPFQNQDHLRYLLDRYVTESIKGIKMVNTDEVPRAVVNLVTEPTPAMETDENSPIAAYALNASGLRKFQYLLYNTEGGTFNRAGAQSIIWGPGSIDQAHKEDEFVLKKWVSQKYVDRYVALIRHFCCEEGI